MSDLYNIHVDGVGAPWSLDADAIGSVTIEIGGVDTVYNYYGTNTLSSGQGYMALPDGYTPFDRGPGQPWDGAFIVGPDGDLSVSDSWLQDSYDNYDALQESLYETGWGVIFVGGAGLLVGLVSGPAGGALGVIGLIAGANTHAQSGFDPFDAQ